MNRIRRAFSVGMAALLLLSPNIAAAAEERPRIALVMHPESQPLAARIGTELGTMGFEALLLLHPAASVEELAALTRSVDAVAGAWISADYRGIRLWVVDRTTDKTLTRELPAAPEMEATLALRAVELLRASLLELALPEARKGERAATPLLLEAAGVPEGETGEARGTRTKPAQVVPAIEPPPAPRPELHASRATLALELGPALIGAGGDLGPFPALFIGAGYFASPELSFGALAYLPLSGVSHRAAEGRSDSRITLLGLDAGWQPASGLLRPFARLGATAVMLRTRGQSLGLLFADAADTALTFGVAARVGGALQLLPGLCLRPQGAAGVQHRYFSIEYASRSAARWGVAWWSASLTLEAQLFR